MGDVIMRDGKNRRNIEEREFKVMAAARKIGTLCGNVVIKKMQMKALFKLHY